MATDLSSNIETAAGTPQSASADGQSASARPIADLIAADQYLAMKQGAGVGKRRGMRFSKILPAGPVSDQAATRTGGPFDDGGGLT